MLLLTIQSTTAEEFPNKNPLNATFLPYTLKTKENINAKGDNFPDMVVLNNDEGNKYEVLENKEFNNEDRLEPGTSNWKRLTSAYLSTYPLQQHYGDQNEFLCKSHTHGYGQQQVSSTALIGSTNFLLSHTLFSILNLGVLSYILLSIVTLVNRLLSYGPFAGFPTNNNFGGHIYKNDFSK